MELDPREHAVLTACSELQTIAPQALFAPVNIQPQTPPLIAVSNRRCTAVLALLGGQVLSFKPDAMPDLLWLSPNAVFNINTPIRGGIPVCLPWFGVNQADPQKPKHGFARTSRWRLEHASTDDIGVTLVQLGLRQFAEQPHPLFPHTFAAWLDFSFGETLAIELRVRNCSQTAMPLSWALHSYHPVQDLDRLRILGLENRDYLDNTRRLRRDRQTSEALGVQDEIDRVYPGVGGSQAILGSPNIRISGVNAPTIIVWNPGAAIAASLPDLGDGTHRQFICVERGAAFDDTAFLAPQASLKAGVVIATGDHSA